MCAIGRMGRICGECALVYACVRVCVCVCVCMQSLGSNSYEKKKALMGIIFQQDPKMGF
jgi:hypothetical protein